MNRINRAYIAAVSWYCRVIQPDEAGMEWVTVAILVGVAIAIGIVVITVLMPAIKGQFANGAKQINGLP
jgi:hypothetical protein